MLSGDAKVARHRSATKSELAVGVNGSQHDCAVTDCSHSSLTIWVKWSATTTWNLGSWRADLNGALVELPTNAWVDTSRLNRAADRALIALQKGQHRSVTTLARAQLWICETPEVSATAVSATAPISRAIDERERLSSPNDTLANLLVERSQSVGSRVECSIHHESISRVSASPESRAFETGTSDLGTHDRTLVESCSTN